MKKKKVEKESWRKKERGRFWKVESREKRKGEDRDIWVNVWWRKIEKKKKKRMDDRKKERKNNI